MKRKDYNPPRMKMVKLKARPLLYSGSGLDAPPVTQVGFNSQPELPKDC
ncbi:hypothetical protein SAMN05720766_10827 [Fibrobacter sp. UWH9]|nr:MULTISPECIES: hypothetical protein [unclassified Fibrobacter]SHH16706.1 hypothetical protein SAMN05720766_10827 [Fibrobacter sp. UWH9]SHL20219.1 hypothetical protein SAMN05720764_10978 [Fibrobacter sp. UWH5]SHL47451.1 hypothetical protein SAMN05720765_11564 [Fibrobacter sp. UWH6]